jgi:hypothetical protein
MNKRSLDLLERVFEAEINGAIGGGGLYQTKSKLAQQLEADGYLQKVSVVIGNKTQFPVTIEGYRLTLLGNATYCMSDRCSGDIDEQEQVE